MVNNLLEGAELIPFKVSARTARLIGRENIATSKGAIIELVKNGYDADSSASVVYFDNKYSEVQREISELYYNELIDKEVSQALLEEVYEKDDENYIFKEGVSEERIQELKAITSKFSSLYIIDFGEGMTRNTIINHWMTIGTNNKETNVLTANGRVKAGAKGIGRFALDKLGAQCEMITIFNPANRDPQLDLDSTNSTGYYWQVNWENFEGNSKTIDKVDAVLNGVDSNSLKEELLRMLPEIDLSVIHSETNDFKYGTILKISELRDNWEDYYVNEVYQDLEVLVPPKESGGYEIFVFSTLTPDKYGEVLGSVCDDFDYKLTAVADDNQNVTITIYRNEYDIELIPNDFWQREGLQKEHYQKTDFLKGCWQKNTTFSKLLLGFNEVDEDKVFEQIGIFDFTFYFLKRATNSSDAQRFFNKNFMSNSRKDWLNKFGGIKLFRDNFRVRPYGEVKNTAFDWLGLGSRKSTSPAGIAKKDGGYKVEPENVAGAIKISRLTNVDFEDKSSREGLQENKTFQVFKNLICEIISVFEEDRAYIAREMDNYDNVRFGAERDRKKAEEIKERILRERRERNQLALENPQPENNTEQPPEDSNQPDPEKEIMASELERQDEEIEKLKEEQKVLRGLASSGIVLAALSHDLSNQKNLLNSRTDKLKELFLEKVSENDYQDAIERRNPFRVLEKIKKQDIKLQTWLNFSLGAARKDKRQRRQLFLKTYFSNFTQDWSPILKERGIKVENSEIEELDLRVFEIDFDSIFNNLFVNSIDAFIRSTHNRERVITIKASSNSKEIVVEYYDTGPGLSPDIENPEKIFEPLFTTKRKPQTSEEAGTGLGMWIVKSIVEENDGKVQLLYPEIGFGLRISFPEKYKR